MNSSKPLPPKKASTQKLRRPRKKTKSSDLILFAVALVLIGGVMLAIRQARKGGKDLELSASKVERIPDVPSSAQTVIVQPTPVKSPESAQKEIQLYSAVMRTGLREIPSKKVGPHLQISVKAQAIAADCSLGDFDFIKGSVDSLNDDSFLLSVEPMSQGKVVSKRLSMRDMIDGKSFDFALPLLDKAKDYGVFLCFDFKKTNECNSKPLLTSRDWKTLLDTIKNNDRVFYYQMATLVEGRAYLIPSFRWDAESIENMRKVLKPVIENDASLVSLKKNTEVLSPIPARLDGRSLVLPLPMRKESCM